MENEIKFDPELKEVVEEGNARTSKILNMIKQYRDPDEGAMALKRALLKFEYSNSPTNFQGSDVIPEQVTIPRSDSGGYIKLNIYRRGNSQLPCIYNIHGGGMIVGNIYNNTTQLSHLSEILEAVVVDVDYRLAPENPYPAGVNDCYDGLVWIFENAHDLNIDSTRIGLFGESAGGGLAAATALKSRDNGGPDILFQTLVAPTLDDRNITPSSNMCSGIWPSWPREMNVLAWRALLGSSVGIQMVSPYAAPSRAENLGKLPPAYIEVGGMEVFRDEAISYARKLMEHNVPVELHVYPGVFHSWYSHVPEALISKRAIRNRIEWIKNQLEKK